MEDVAELRGSRTSAELQAPRWTAHPIAATAVKVLVAVVPIAASLLFVVIASRLVPAPSDLLIGYLAWWLGLCAASTAVLVVIDKVARRCLPLSTLLGLSLVFPDQAPSRFKIALRTGTVRQLHQVVEDARVGKVGETPAEAAERVLELVAALNAHDRITRGHSERVRAYTKMIGEELGLAPSEVDLLHWAGLLHDIGKLEVPYEILNKTSRPTDEEWEIIKRHPEVGAAMVAPLRDWLGQWALAVGEHHEKWDGTGYPTGLAGNDISLAARIVSVADVFDVITSARSYKEPIDAQTARVEISRCAGTHFDPDVVRAFLAISLGRLRLAMGPLSLLAQSPLGGISIPPVIGAAASGLAIGVASLVGGTVAGPHPAAASAPAPTRAVASAPTPRAPAVRPVDGAPSATADEVTIDEGTTAWIRVLDNDSDPGQPPLLLTSVTRPAVGRAEVVGDQVRYTPPADFVGTSRFAYRVSNGSGASVDATITVRVRPVDHTPVEGAPVNRPPVAVPDVVTVTENQTTVLDPLANDADPDGDVLTMASIAPPAVGRARTVGDLVVYTPPVGYSGPDSLGYTVADPSGASASAAITIEVVPVNDPPSFTAGPDQSVVEDAGAQVVAGWATGISPGPADESGQTVSFTLVGDNASLFAVVPAVAADGTLTYTPAPNAFGSATFTITATDDGVGSATSAAQTFTITVVPVNDAPRFTAGPDQSVLEDAGARVVAGWATGISPGPADESGQTVSFTVVGDNAWLFAVAPAVAADGTLTYTPAPNASGSATVTVRAVDNGGTANGGQDTSAAQTFTITVVPVNDAPSFTAGPDQSVVEDAGAQVVPSWATGISPGPANESGQSVGFAVSNDNGALFSVAPAMDASGTLTFTPATDAFGSATVTVRAVDDGGTANGGVDTSAAQTFTITVVPVPPSPQPDAYTLHQDATLTVVAPGILGNDYDDLGKPLTVVTSAAAGPSHGAVVLHADGSFTYTPDPGFLGTDGFTYRVDDGAGLSATATVSITVDSGLTPGSFYLGTSGSSASNYDLTTTPPPAASPVPDFDGDGRPGLTLKSSDGKENVADLSKFHLWTYAPASALSLDGPVTLELWSSVKNFDLGQKGQVHAYLYDCVLGGVSCVKVGQGQLRRDPWNSAPTWTDHVLDLGSVTRTIVVGHELRVRVLESEQDLWVAMTAAYPSQLHVTRANAAPVANADAPTVLEDAPVTNLAVLANDTDANLDPSTVAITAAATKGTATALADGTVNYTPDPDANGTDTFTYRVCDTGGLCSSAIVTVTITAVNDAPRYVAGPGQSTLEDAGAQTVAAWATGISPGPADESGQSISFSVTSDNPALFAGGPAVAADGTLTYTPAPDANGSATVTVRAVDAGGTANGGIDTSPPQTFTITVGPVNDAPSFSLGALATGVGGVPGSFAAWASPVRPGPADEAGQSVSFTVTTDNPALFSVQPSIAPDGTLTFTGGLLPGSAVVTVTLADNGGTANGGVDTSSAQTFVILIL